MTDITDVVQVNISIQDATPKVPNFGTIMLVGSQGGVGVSTYKASASGLTAMGTAGHLSSGLDSSYNKAQALAAANPGVPDFKVYKRSTTNAQELRFIPTNTAEGRVVGFKLMGVDVLHTNGAAETLATVVTALQVLANAVTGVTASDDTTHLSLTPTTSGQRIYLQAVQNGTVKDQAPDAGIAAELAACLGEDPDFYGVAIDATCQAEIEAASIWCLANKKILIAHSYDTADVPVSGSSDVASVVGATSNHYSVISLSQDGRGEFAVGAFGRQFSRTPGSSTMHLKTVPGATPDAWSTTQFGFIRGKNVLSYVNISGILGVFDGKAVSGRFIDITRGLDWLEANMGADLLTVIANQEKVDYDDDGIALLEAAVRKRLQIAVRNGLLQPNWTVTAIAEKDVTTADKGNRVYTGLSFQAQLTGAIHTVIPVEGTITL